MFPFRADLHCHTSCSDGSCSPVELIALAKKEGLQGLSITDHDTTEAYETAVPAAKEAGILLGTGVEFSCDFQGSSVHILGYDYPLASSELRSFSLAHHTRRAKRNHLILEKLKRLGLSIEEAELERKDRKMIGRPHIAELMVERGFVSTIKEAFQLYLGEGKSCYHPGDPFPVQETIDLLHSVGGKAFLAHPHLINNARLIRSLLALNFDGLECYYARCLPQKEKKWLKIAKDKKWLISGGSDFHGTIKPQIPLACSWVDEQAFHAIFQKNLGT